MIHQTFEFKSMGLTPYLKFKNTLLEQEFNDFNLPFLKREVRAGIIMVILSWLLYANMEPMNAPITAFPSIAITALAGAGSLAIVYLATFLQKFKRHHQIIVLAGVLVTMLTVSVKIKFYPDFPIAHYLPVLICITFWMFAISGVSFIYSVACGLIFYIFVYMAFLMDGNANHIDIVTSLYYMLISYFMGAVITFHKDIQSRKIFLAHKELELEKQHHHHKSIHDVLTQLPNRELLEDRIVQAINMAARTNTACAGIFIDLDNFKSINDQHGHAAGDLYLQEVANRLRDITREADTIARISGDEFFLLMLDVKDEESVLGMALKIQENLKGQFLLNDLFELTGLGASVGVCMFPYQNCTPHDIINRADKAMYEVKYLVKNNAVLT
jgi:diguanylate cyclase (GGDEF)-like protein